MEQRIQSALSGRGPSSSGADGGHVLSDQPDGGLSPPTARRGGGRASRRDARGRQDAARRAELATEGRGGPEGGVGGAEEAEGRGARGGRRVAHTRVVPEERPARESAAPSVRAGQFLATTRGTGISARPARGQAAAGNSGRPPATAAKRLAGRSRTASPAARMHANRGPRGIRRGPRTE